jgi:hypothetical protein
MMQSLEIRAHSKSANICRTPKAFHSKAQRRPELVEGRTLGIGNESSGYAKGVKHPLPLIACVTPSA